MPGWRVPDWPVPDWPAPDWLALDWATAAARGASYLALCLLAGLVLYRRVIARQPEALPRGLVAALALAGIAASAGWLLATAAAMAERPLLAPDWQIVRLIALETAMGKALLVRLAALALLLFLPPRPGLVALPAGAALATLAWTGHAAGGEGAAGALHLVADVVHMLAAALWLGALASFLVGIYRKEHPAGLAGALAAFARPGSAIVAVLVVTGTVNVLAIRGEASLAQLAGSPWGTLMQGKLLLLGVMLAAAAANRWWLTPRLAARRGAGAERAKVGLRLVLAGETLAWLGIAALIAVLGMLDPLGAA